MKKMIKKQNMLNNEQVADEVNGMPEMKEANTNMILLNAVNKKVADRFGIGEGYSLVAFNDGKSAKITLDSEDYKVTIELQGRALYNLKEELGLLDGM
jgi:phosphoribosylamine-glycine ligase